MSIKLPFALLLVAGSWAWAADYAPMDVKTGVWETTMTTQTTGSLPIPESALAKMTPAQRAQFEAAMKEQFAKPQTTTHRSCVKKEDLNRALFDNDARKNCKETLISASSTKREVHMECKEQEGTAAGTIRIEAASSESVKITGQLAFSAGKNGLNTVMNGTAKWIGATCTGKED
ncbi:MAG TPA: DUF3617 family protein [Bryobacteraceae bacterium]|jgi:hypothetical protein